MLFADLGAEVIRIDRPASGPQRVPDPRFDLTTRGRSSVALDLKRPGAAQAVLRIAEHCDILVEGFRPGVAERLGVGPQDCLDRQPALVYARMTGWGQTGPLAPTAGHDINYIAIAGALHNFRRPGEIPLPPTNLLGDFGGGALYLAFGVLAALTEARRSGLGQVVDAAIVDGTANLLAMQLGLMAAGVWDAERPGTNTLDSGAPFYNVYQTADGGYVSVGAIEPRFYSELVAGLGIDEAELPPQLKRRWWEQTRKRFAEIFRTRTRDKWADHFAGTDACVTPVLSVAEAAKHPHLRHRDTYVRGSGDVLQPAPAPRFSRTPSTLPASPGHRARTASPCWSDTGSRPPKWPRCVRRARSTAPLRPRPGRRMTARHRGRRRGERAKDDDIPRRAAFHRRGRGRRRWATAGRARQPG
jgi:alpha-methylacyl-CoA racemase